MAVITEGAPPAITPAHTVGIGYLSLVATGAAFAVWSNGIAKLPAHAPPLLGLAAPLTGATLGWIVLGENLNAVQILGFAVTVTAIGYSATIRVETHPSNGDASAPDVVAVHRTVCPERSERVAPGRLIELGLGRPAASTVGRSRTCSSTGLA